MSNHFVLGVIRNFLEAQLGDGPVKLVGPETRRLLDMASPTATILNTDRLEYHFDQSVRLTAFSIIMKLTHDGRMGFMVLGREEGHFSLGLTQEIPLNQISCSPLNSSDINLTESLLRADSTNRCKVRVSDKGKEVVIPTVSPIGFVRSGFGLSQRYTRNIGVLFPHVVKFDSFMLHYQSDENFNGVTWMSPEQVVEFCKENTFDPWSEELIKCIDKFLIHVSQTL